MKHCNKNDGVCDGDSLPPRCRRDEHINLPDPEMLELNENL